MLDGMGTLLDLEPPAPLLVERLAGHGLQLTLTDAQAAFAVEIGYYREHHLRGRDEAGLAALRSRCAAVLHSRLPASVSNAIDPQQLQLEMLQCLRFSVYPEVPGVLRALRRTGLRLWVLSNWDVSLGALLAQKGLREHLDGVLTSAETGSAKPHVEIFREALRRAGVKAVQALHVGDSLQQDVLGAIECGIAAVWLRRTATPELLEGPDVPVIPSLEQLPALIT
jgi:putative hydrolase of the HAD superfamily